MPTPDGAQILSLLLEASARVRSASVAGTPDDVLAVGASETQALLEATRKSDGSKELGPASDATLAQLAIVIGLAVEAARLRARVETVSRAREMLLASVAHDLRNPLNTFAMSAGLLRDDLERNDVDAARALNLVSRMDRATTRMQLFIEDLVEASRIDARKIDLKMRDESAAQIVKEAVASAAKTAADKAAAVAADTTLEDASVTVDRARVLQLLSKVIAFETKATGEGGKILLGVSRDGANVVFTARAFGPDDSAVAPPDEGRGGLALMIARGLTEALHGTFRIDGSAGLTVAITLPAAK